MRKYVSDAIAQQVLTQYDIANIFISRGSLQEAPVLNELHDVVEYSHRCIDNLSGTRINPGWSHRIGYRRRCVTDTRILNILGIKIRVVFREVFSYNSILETNLFECFLPYFNSFVDIFVPVQRERIINIENDGLLGLHQFTTKISSRVRWLQIPSVSNVTSA